MDNVPKVGGRCAARKVTWKRYLKRIERREGWATNLRASRSLLIYPEGRER